jgi:hypothetical protein
MTIPQASMHRQLRIRRAPGELNLPILSASTRTPYGCQEIAAPSPRPKTHLIHRGLTYIKTPRAVAMLTA